MNRTLKNPLFTWQSILCHTLSCHSPFLLKIPSAIGNMIPEKFLWNWFVVCDRCGSLDTVTGVRYYKYKNFIVAPCHDCMSTNHTHTHICQVHVSIHRVDCQVSARLISIKIGDELRERERERKRQERHRRRERNRERS